MATAIRFPEPRKAIERVSSDRILLHEVPWEVYELLRGERSNWQVRMTYHEGDLEFMSPSQTQGEMECRFDLFLMELARTLVFKCKPLGNTTWSKPEQNKGKEADCCFYIANFHQVRKKKIDLAIDPPPDLAFEVEVSRSALDALNIYAAIGVPEIWRFDGETLQIHVRLADSTYREVAQSPSLPFLRPEEVVAWMMKAEEIDDDANWIQQVQDWARLELLPRLDPR